MAKTTVVATSSFRAPDTFRKGKPGGWRKVTKDSADGQYDRYVPDPDGEYTRTKGERVYIGALFDSADAVVKAHPDLFGTPEDATPVRGTVITSNRPPVQEATAVPGEKRPTSG